MAFKLAFDPRRVIVVAGAEFRKQKICSYVSVLH